MRSRSDFKATAAISDVGVCEIHERNDTSAHLARCVLSFLPPVRDGENFNLCFVGLMPLAFSRPYYLLCTLWKREDWKWIEKCSRARTNPFNSVNSIRCNRLRKVKYCIGTCLSRLYILRDIFIDDLFIFLMKINIKIIKITLRFLPYFRLSTREHNCFKYINLNGISDINCVNVSSFIYRWLLIAKVYSPSAKSS